MTNMEEPKIAGPWLTEKTEQQRRLNMPWTIGDYLRNGSPLLKRQVLDEMFARIAEVQNSDVDTIIAGYFKAG